MTIRELKTLALTGTTTIDVAPGGNFIYKITCGLNFGVSGSISITANGAPQVGTKVVMYANFTGVSGYNESTAFCSLFGTVVPAELAVTKFQALAVYTGSWEVYFTPDWKSDDIIATSHIQANAITTAEIINSAVTTDKIANSAVDANKIATNAVITAKIIDSAVTLAKMADMPINGFIANDNGGNQPPQVLNLTETRTLLAQSVTLTGDILASSTAETYATGNTQLSTTIANGAVTISKVDNPLKRELITGVCSFETGEVGYIAVKVPWKCTIDDWMVNVIKTISGTDNGTCELYDHSGTLMTGSGITVPLATPVGNVAPPNAFLYNAAVTGNNTLNSGEILTIKTAKTTAGGRMQFSIKATLIT